MDQVTEQVVEQQEEQIVELTLEQLARVGGGAAVPIADGVRLKLCSKKRALRSPFCLSTGLDKGA
jgi:hypothetical protein